MYTIGSRLCDKRLSGRSEEVEEENTKTTTTRRLMVLPAHSGILAISVNTLHHMVFFLTAMLMFVRGVHHSTKELMVKGQESPSMIYFLMKPFRSGNLPYICLSIPRSTFGPSCLFSRQVRLQEPEITNFSMPRGI